MCGIIAIYGAHLSPCKAASLCETVKHRGPDNLNYLIHDDIFLGHTRLAIVDLQPESNQPLECSEGDYAIVFNGEIYNHLEIRKLLECEGYAFETRSDTEVLLKAYVHWGTDCLSRLNGMFAFAILHRPTKTLFLARDRLGIKPLYYASENGRFVFASEIKSIIASGIVPKVFNSSVITGYLAYRFIPHNETCFNGILPLEPGHYAIIQDSSINISCYWSTSIIQERRMNQSDALEEFTYLLEDSVRLRTSCDVPFGLYLSSGIDSTVILHIMAKLLKSPVNTFTAEFATSVGEGNDASLMASLYSCNHTQVAVTEQDLLLLPRILHHLDQPQGDPIILPSYRLSQEASKSVKMVLTGEGADEILGGYQFMKTVHYLSKYNFAQAPLHHIVKILPDSFLNYLSNHPGHLADKSRKRILEVLAHSKLSRSDKLDSLLMLFDKSDIYRLTHRSLVTRDLPECSYSFQQLQLHLLKDWLPNNILWRQDHMSMANSVEARVPFLDHRIVEFGLRIPTELKISRLTDKILLRKYTKKNVPGYNSTQRKKPFYMPLAKYLESTLFQDYLNEYLSSSALQNGFFDSRAIRKIVADSRNDDFLYGKQLFSVLMFQMWYRSFFV